MPPAYASWSLGEYLRHRARLRRTRIRIEWCGFWTGHRWEHYAPDEDRCSRCEARHLHDGATGCRDPHAGEAWVPTPAEQAVLDRQWVVRNSVCGHVSIIGPRPQCEAMLAKLSGLGWRLSLGATAMDAERVARGDRCERCS